MIRTVGERIRRLQPKMHTSFVCGLLRPEQDRLECPCHQGYFSVKNGSVLQGPPTRPLPRVVLERKGDELIALKMNPEV